MIKKQNILLFFLLAMAQTVFAQDAPNPKIRQALLLLEDYESSSQFNRLDNGLIDPAQISLFKDCFAEGRNIIFDIPVKQSDRPSKTPDGPGNNITVSNTSFDKTVDMFLKYVTISRYIQLVRSELYQNTDISDIKSLNYDMIILGHDNSKLETDNRIIFEIEKRYSETLWLRADKRRYLFEISFLSDGPKITSVKFSNTEFTRNVVKLKMEQKYLTDDISQEVNIELRIDFEENVFDRAIKGRTDSLGTINLGMVANRAKLIIDKVYGINNERFTLPSEWQTKGVAASTQPVGGFPVSITPYQWKGFSYTGKLNVGIIGQSAVNVSNFSDDSGFQGDYGYKFGGDFNLNWFANPKNWRNQKNNLIWGFGSGVSFHYVKYNTKSSQFNQNAYTSIDPAGDTCEILFMGRNYEETLGTGLIKIPLYGVVRKKVKNRFLGFKSFSLQAGANFMIPFLSRFRYEGIFSRHGRYYYPENNDGQIITDDTFYNYYTDKDIEDDGVVDYKNFMIEGLVRLNGFIPLSDQNLDHSLVVSLEFSTPFSGSHSRNTADYQISSGDDEFTSTAHAREKLYEYYFGISIGLNFINYRPE